MSSWMNFFISNAYADVLPGPSQQTNGFSFITLLVIFFVFMYFMIIRPQNKRAKEQQNLINSLAKGDEVVTAGGLLGKINKVADQYLVLSIANQVDIVIQKNSIVNVLPKGTIKSVE